MREHEASRTMTGPGTRNAFGYIFRVNADPEENAIPPWMELGDLERLIDYRVFVFKTKAEFRKRLGARTCIEMTRLESVAADSDIYVADIPLSEAARWYAIIRVLYAKTVVVRTLYRDTRPRWVVEFYLDDRRLTDILRERGYIG